MVHIIAMRRHSCDIGGFDKSFRRSERGAGRKEVCDRRWIVQLREGGI